MLRDFPAFDPGKFLTAWCEARFRSGEGGRGGLSQALLDFLADPETGKRAMLDGEWMHAATRLAKSLATRLEKGGKSDGKTAGLLKKLRPQHRQVEQAAQCGADRGQARRQSRELFENNLMAQHKILLGLLRWVDHVAEAGLALDERQVAVPALQAHEGSAALIDAGKALASRGEFQDWYRGDRKMNCRS